MVFCFKHFGIGGFRNFSFVCLLYYQSIGAVINSAVNKTSSFAQRSRKLSAVCIDNGSRCADGSHHALRRTMLHNQCPSRLSTFFLSCPTALLSSS